MGSLTESIFVRCFGFLCLCCSVGELDDFLGEDVLGEAF
jgi:hypothetical protein